MLPIIKSDNIKEFYYRRIIFSFRILLACGAPTETVNTFGYTPLHCSVDIGSEDCTYLLLKNDANPNLFGFKPFYHFTPLHLAKTVKMVKLLLRFEADPCLDSETKGIQKGRRSTLFQSLLSRQPKAALELLNLGVMTNGESLDSDQLLVILDYNQLLHEGSHSCNRHNQNLTPLNETPSSQNDSDQVCDELAIHKKVLEARCRHMITHPILESFLNLNWQLTKPFYYAHLFMYSIFLLSITGLVLLETHWLRCNEQIWKRQENVTNQTLDATFCKCKRICPDISEHRQGLNDFDDNDCYWKWISTNENDVMKCHDEDNVEYVLFLLSWVGWIFLLVREIMQFIQGWRAYLKSNENWMEVTLILISGLFLLTMFFSSISIVLKQHLGSWALFFGWIEVTLLIGRFPLVGVLIHMSLQVIKQLLVCMLIFFPVMIAFGLAFHVLLRSNPEFENSIGAVLKVLTTMAGEFEYYDNFAWDATIIDKAYVSVQLLFILLFGFLTIIIMNLLIGLTVTKLDDLSRKAEIIRLEKMVTLISSNHELFLSRNFSLQTILKKWNLTRIGQIGSLFNYIKIKQNEMAKEFTKQPYVKSSHSDFTFHYISESKICFEPNKEKMNSDSRTQKIRLFETSGLPVYLYNERTGAKEADIKLKLPDNIAKNCMDLINDKDEQSLKYKVKTLEDEFDLHNMQQKMRIHVKNDCK